MGTIEGKPQDLTQGLTYAKQGNLPYQLTTTTGHPFNEILMHNTSARIIQSNQSLVLQSVTRNSAGYYACAATNSIRETRSEPLLFRVKFAPICKEDQIIVVGASRGESLNISCKVEADPPVRNFRWKFNNSGATLEVSPKQFTIPMHGDTDGVSILKYTPVTDVDYGTLSCWADNEVGTQARPCLFQIVTAGIIVTKKYDNFGNSEKAETDDSKPFDNLKVESRLTSATRITT
ncbi:hypothetical protein KQX54_020062 [Cotesia glomerata]|uniref:Ig-like domain-containing protein n=1 Tax=Cotesia glomerata TaxID=32391 RepID=A0AAV7J7M9_COTGL|nr:hypothetical protein KQX54_020062 [Cotesia glomerata]